MKVDLGYIKNITYGTQVGFEKSGVAYQYKIETSKDNTNWTLKVDKTNNTSTEKVQTDYFTDYARYVRITVTGCQAGLMPASTISKSLETRSIWRLGKPVSTDSADPANPASYGNDGLTTTRWDAADGLTGTGGMWILDQASRLPIPK